MAVTPSRNPTVVSVALSWLTREIRLRRRVNRTGDLGVDRV
jgi:hypothetical protein